jgi:hypothetical protein
MTITGGEAEIWDKGRTQRKMKTAAGVQGQVLANNGPQRNYQLPGEEFCWYTNKSIC